MGREAGQAGGAGHLLVQQVGASAAGQSPLAKCKVPMASLMTFFLAL